MIATPILIGILVAQWGQSLGGGDSAEAWWRREYPSAVERIESKIRAFSAEGRFSYRYFDGTEARSDPFLIAAWEDVKLLRLDGREVKDSGKNSFVPGSAEIMCEAPEYVFTLVRRRGAHGYKIDQYGPNRGDPNPTLVSRFPVIARAAIAYQGQTLLSRSQQSTFELQAADETVVDGRRLVRLTYKVMIDRRDESGTVVGHSDESGSVHLDPSLGWVIRKVDVSFHDAHGTELILQGNADYAATDPSPFLPSGLERTIKIPKSGKFQQMVAEFDDIRPEKPPESIFRLSGYGLPDIPLSPEPGPTFYTWSNPLLWGAFAAAVVSFVLLWSLPWRARAETT